MKKVFIPIITIYFAAILENSFLNYFPIYGQNLGLTILSFLIFVILFPWTKRQLLILGFWTGLMLDIFLYSGFGLGLIAILILVSFYQGSHRWFKTPKKISGQIIWFFFYNILFYLSLEATNLVLTTLFPHFFSPLIIHLSSLGIQLLYNTGAAAIILFLYHQGKKIFLR